MAHDQDLVVVHTTPSMFSDILVHVWRVVWRFDQKPSISVHCGSNSFGMPKGAIVSLALNELK